MDNPITLTYDHVLLAAKIITCLAAVYTLFELRSYFNLNAKDLKNVLIVAITVGAFTVMVADWRHETPEQREVRLEKEEVEEQQEKIAEQKEKREERDRFEDKLPGKWGKLYQAMRKINGDDMRIATIESFIIHYGTSIEELLPMEGLELILDLMWSTDPKNQIRTTLIPYFIPFRDETLIQKPKYGPKIPRDGVLARLARE